MPNIEVLKGLVTEETYNALSTELEGKDIKLADLTSGNYVDKAKYDTAVKDSETYKEQLAQRDTDIEELKKTSTGEETTQKLNDLQSKYDQEKETWEQQLRDNQFNAAVDVAIAQSGTKDTVALRAHVYNKAKESEFKDGQIIGFSEYLSEQLSGDLKHLSSEVKATGAAAGTPPKREKTLEEDLKEKLYR
ncbi:hypothetical protein G7062_11305 [Erysipelothrix sp. HDW6C]|uniref:phage scaffolding protein n=1 Tax=Erysipelothrix sp. HDW6C TaxID=2714930 RepID=UPI00140B5DC2|nr:phage scaffolding protein [Erysipelothrix sp. HDW6C]QIK70845.1 hypothetical protein G7062_11305 [Erysipelothrix sp. HDW6C]